VNSNPTLSGRVLTILAVSSSLITIFVFVTAIPDTHHLIRIIRSHLASKKGYVPGDLPPPVSPQRPPSARDSATPAANPVDKLGDVAVSPSGASPALLPTASAIARAADRTSEVGDPISVTPVNHLGERRDLIADPRITQASGTRRFDFKLVERAFYKVRMEPHTEALIHFDAPPDAKLDDYVRGVQIFANKGGYPPFFARWFSSAVSVPEKIDFRQVTFLDRRGCESGTVALQTGGEAQEFFVSYSWDVILE
jgi:hypothetical protein